MFLSLLTTLVWMAADVPTGSTAPDFSLPDGEGKIHRLQDSRGVTTVVFFYRGHW